MTTKDAFTPDEWTLVLEAPTSAGMLVVTASHGGTFRESFAMSKAYADARAEHGKSELLDEIVGTKPKVDRDRPHSAEELKSNALQHVRDAAALVGSKATDDELEDYRNFVLSLAHTVAAAHREGGQEVSAAEAAALQDIGTALGVATT